ncbi:MAG: MCE family protein [Bdellovibrionales bacterium]|nr:MCE family protein [Bdellovibrionales bacterium]
MAYDYNQKQSLKSGIFMFIGLVAIIISIIMLSGNKSLFFNNFVVKAKFNEVQGLNIGSVVSVSGINVGNIKKIEFTSEPDEIVVTMSVENQYKNRLTKNSLASIKTQGALGDKYIYISPGEPSQELLSSGEFIQVDTKGDLFDVISAEGHKLANIVEVVSELKILLANFNKDGNSAKLVASLLETSQQSQKLISEGKMLISDLRGKDNKELLQTVQHLNNILAKIDRGEGSLGALINDPIVHERLTSLLGKPPRNSYLKPLIRATIKSND